MGEVKTHVTDSGVETLIDAIPDQARREDCRALLKLMKKVTGEEPAVWSSCVVGFGTFHYKHLREAARQRGSRGT